MGLLFIAMKGNCQSGTIYNTANSPLPENSVRSLAIDNNNGLWIGTDYGLSYLKNNNWINYSSTNSPLPGNSIRALFVDGDSLWIGTSMGGLALKNDTIWTIYNTTNSLMPDDQINSINKANNGKLWIGTTGGLAIFDGITWEISNNLNSPLLSNNITCIEFDTAGIAWMGTINGGLVKLQDTLWTIMTISSSFAPDNTFLELKTDLNNKLWAATPSAGLVLYHGNNLWTAYNMSNSQFPTNTVLSLEIDSSGNVYAGTFNEGIVIKNNNSFSVLNTFNSFIPDDKIQELLLEGDSILWAGTQTGGLVKLYLSSLTSTGEENNNVKNISIYPNPCNDFISLDFPIGNDFIIFDLLGKSVKNFAMENNQININELKSGIYFFVIHKNNEILFRQKFIKN